MLEAAGVSTGVHCWIPELAESVRSPRVVGIGYPGSLPFGPPGDADGQRQVLRSSLEAVAAMSTPGQRTDLPFEWPAGVRIPRHPNDVPITLLIKRKPWLYLKLLKGEIP
ncbi:MAG: hypothetical protein KDD47_17455 [Acidobacteria bacterium]|nr:hypothetical protein [Acidobacteriota bacterium]